MWHAGLKAQATTRVDFDGAFALADEAEVLARAVGIEVGDGEDCLAGARCSARR